MQTDKPKLKRCAIYTRKSSEEGLEQEFNSLHAQREACEAYIKSQTGEGWRVNPTEYDDGGISGGTMERPGLIALLSDIEAGLVDIVVVYKVDRLTRSLSDFAKIIDVFDRQGASFVAVTQQFNTTSSMGRLTLNILLSFAQFEREVTGERIRDKLAASKGKGMWMGGLTPLGYDARDRSLIINDREAEQIRYIFNRYNELNKVSDLKRDIDAKGIFSKTRISASGNQTGNLPISKGNLYSMLHNPVYIGEIRHKELCHPGLHEPIISRELWDATQIRLANNRQGNKQRSLSRSSSPLFGKLFDEIGERLVPIQTTKQGRKYYYYISHFLIDRNPGETRRGWRFPASGLEQTIQESINRLVHDQMQLSSALRQAGFSVTQASELTKAIQNRRVRENDPFP
jgi:DNA invertase Pin-like site-specific DNA recombinase